jgi:carbonic anhydrase
MKAPRLLLCLLLISSVPWFAATRLARAAEESHPAVPHASGEVVEPAEAIQRLAAGNKRFAEDKPQHPHQAHDWRNALAKAQKPFAVVLGCSDSRVPPELVFDQGLGDLFVIRVAGNIAEEDAIGSVEYAVDHLNVRLVVILGHSSCGAVSAALDHLSDPAEEPSEIVSLLYRIEPALVGIRKDQTREAQVAEAVKRNVDLAVRRLSRVPDMRKSLKEGRVKIVGAVYDMTTGKVDMLP